MKKFLSIIISVTLVITLFSGCSTNTVQITAENFEQYFEVNVTLSDFESSKDSYFAGIPFITTASVKLTITITPKQSIKGGSVYVVLEEDFFDWSSEYTSNDSFSMPVQFSPTQTYTKTIELTNSFGFFKPHLELKIAEASGRINI